jgi:hypothetical protein
VCRRVHREELRAAGAPVPCCRLQPRAQAPRVRRPRQDLLKNPA